MGHSQRARAGPDVSWDRLRPSRPALALAALALVGADWGSQLAGSSFFPGGPLDELAHLLTTLLVVWALGHRARERLMIPALIASVAIDLDHVPQYLGANWLTAGTPRPYTHALLIIGVVLLAATLWPRRRTLLIGIGLGLAIHLWRDLAEPGSGVALLWPFSDHSFSLSHTRYVGVMVAIVLIDAWRSPQPAAPAPVTAK
jgi:inner membrane protein